MYLIMLKTKTIKELIHLENLYAGHEQTFEEHRKQNHERKILFLKLYNKTIDRI